MIKNKQKAFNFIKANKDLFFRCPYCQEKVECIDSGEIYSRSFGYMYICRQCDAYVGCHPYSRMPLGTVADKETRKMRNEVHKLFDPLWEEQSRAKRSRCYRWLASMMKLKPELCHVGLFDFEQCAIAIDILRARHKELGIVPQEPQPKTFLFSRK